jgi:cytidine deaminase
MLPVDVDILIKEAEEARTHAIAPFSGFTVGVALVTEGGTVYRGCNIENPSLMLSVCAERVAIVKALSEGERSFRAMAIISGDGRDCFPCGACRQLLAEFAPEIEIYLASDAGIRKYTLPGLLPYPFIK